MKIQESAFSESQEVQDLIKESRELLKEKTQIQEKIRQFKISLRKANRDMEHSEFLKHKASTQTPALAQNSSIDMTTVNSSSNMMESSNLQLGKRRSRGDLEDYEDDNKYSSSKRQKYSHQRDEQRRDSRNEDRRQDTNNTPRKIQSVVASSGLMKKEKSNDQQDHNKNQDLDEQPALISLKSEEKLSPEERKAQRAKKWQLEEEAKQDQKDKADYKQEKQKSQTNQLQSKNTEERGVGNRSSNIEQKPEQVRRSRNLFGNMLKHLEKAKSRLEEEKDQLQKQVEVQQKIQEKLSKEGNMIQEIQLTEIERNMKSQIEKKRNIERNLIILNEQVRNQKTLEHLKKLSNFIQTDAKTQIFWMPAKQNDKTQLALKQTKLKYDEKIEQFKKEATEKLQERLQIYDQKVEMIDQMRKTYNENEVAQKTILKEESKTNEKKNTADRGNISDLKSGIEVSPTTEKQEEPERDNENNIEDDDEEEDLIDDLYNMS